MSELDTYLAENFLSESQFAARCRLSSVELLELIRGRLIPAPSYEVSESSIVTSHVFGSMEAPGSGDGCYFHPANVVWVYLARRVISEAGRERAYDELRRRFTMNFQAALADLNRTMWRLRDTFDDDGSVIDDGLNARLASAWEHFLHGTFGLCVASPVSEAAIAYKEILQEKLTALSGNADKAGFTEAEAQSLLELIEAYARAAMPFSPVEYSRSSRKRLVEDLRAHIMSRR